MYEEPTNKEPKIKIPIIMEDDDGTIKSGHIEIKGPVWLSSVIKTLEQQLGWLFSIDVNIYYDD